MIGDLNAFRRFQSFCFPNISMCVNKCLQISPNVPVTCAVKSLFIC